MQQMDRIDNSSDLLAHPPGDGDYAPWSAPHVMSGKAQRSGVAVLRQRVATQSGAALGVRQGPFNCRI
jgi:hypothetical protein